MRKGADLQSRPEIHSSRISAVSAASWIWCFCDGDSIVFVEVRLSGAANGLATGLPASPPPNGKGSSHEQQQAWLKRHSAYRRSPCRFDVVSVTGPESDQTMKWIKRAFEALDQPASLFDHLEMSARRGTRPDRCRAQFRHLPWRRIGFDVFRLRTSCLRRFPWRRLPEHWP